MTVRLRGMVVDDDPFMRVLTSTLLGQLDVEADLQASDGEQALALLADEHVDVVVCDLNMPGMDGVSLLRHLAGRPNCPAVILFSGEDRRVLSTAEQLGSAHALDVLGTVTKPPTLETLEPLVARVEPRQRHAHEPVDVPPPTRGPDPLTPREVEEGLARGALTMAFQPQVRTSDRALVGVEALARWDHPQRGLLGPWAFIGVAEEHGLIGEITRQALDQSIAQAASWHRDGRDLTVSVNVTIDDLADVSFADAVIERTQAHGLPAERLILEVTESKVMREVAAPLEVLTRLRMRRVGLALDDYGTGASSMEQLARIPFTELKIDRSFVSRALADTDARAMLESAVELARRLDLVALAEGVETEAEWDLVTSLGCERVQGYLVAPPLPVDRLEEWTVGWTADTAAR